MLTQYWAPQWLERAAPRGFWLHATAWLRDSAVADLGLLRRPNCAVRYEGPPVQLGRAPGDGPGGRQGGRPAPPPLPTLLETDAVGRQPKAQAHQANGADARTLYATHPSIVRASFIALQSLHAPGGFDACKMAMMPIGFEAMRLSPLTRPQIGGRGRSRYWHPSLRGDQVSGSPPVSRVRTGRAGNLGSLGHPHREVAVRTATRGICTSLPDDDGAGSLVDHHARAGTRLDPKLAISAMKARPPM